MGGSAFELLSFELLIILTTDNDVISAVVQITHYLFIWDMKFIKFLYFMKKYRSNNHRKIV